LTLTECPHDVGHGRVLDAGPAEQLGQADPVALIVARAVIGKMNVVEGHPYPRQIVGPRSDRADHVGLAYIGTGKRFWGNRRHFVAVCERSLAAIRRVPPLFPPPHPPVRPHRVQGRKSRPCTGIADPRPPGHRMAKLEAPTPIWLALYQDRFAELSSNNDELASVHHGVSGDQHEQVAHCRAEIAEVFRRWFVEVRLRIRFKGSQ
jgi:hypothetical protein